MYTVGLDSQQLVVRHARESQISVVVVRTTGTGSIEALGPVRHRGGRLLPIGNVPGGSAVVPHPPESNGKFSEASSVQQLWITA